MDKTILIQPKNLLGFVELLPEEQIVFNQIMDVIKLEYEKFGFLPLDTPVLEYSEILLAKANGETEKQIYRFNKGQDMCMRFDHTVPLAKFIAINSNNLVFPFRGYQIGKVYRGERPQKGRFREFYQCDIDIVGKDKLSSKFDAEIPSVIFEIFTKLNFGKFTINISNRKCLVGLVENLNLSHLKFDILRLVDKIDKIGILEIKEILQSYKINKEDINKIIDFLNISGTNDEKLLQLKNLEIDNKTYLEGVYELNEVVDNIRSLGVKEDYFSINLSIARGFDYYTGVIYEIFLDEYKNIGSICSGGRYDNLASHYSKSKFPGVGISIGLTRLFSILKEKNLISFERKTLSKVLIIPLMDELEHSLKLAKTLRKNNINTEVYLEDDKFKNKLSYADKLSIPYVIIVGDDEIKQNKFSLKNMKTGEQESLAIEDIIKKLNCI